MCDANFECIQSDVCDSIMKHAPFQCLAMDEKKRLAHTFEHAFYFKGEYLLRQDHLPARFGIVKSGSADIVFRSKHNKKVIVQTIGPNDFFGLSLISPLKKTLYNIRCNEPMSCYIQKPEDFTGMIEGFPHLKEYINDILLNRIWKAYDAVYKEGGEKKEGSDGGEPETSNFGKAIVYISMHYMEPLSLDDVASIAGISKYHFSRLFKSKTGHSFRKYVNIKRIEAAKRAMRSEAMTVTEACFGVGYNDLSYFSRVFKEVEGVTPSSYYKNNRL